MTAVSIVLPVRNGEASLARAIESCLGQTFEDFELFVVDDHSVDASREIAEGFSAKDARVRVLETPRPGGLVTALQIGCEAARGEFIARMDADDFSYPERLEKQVGLLRARPELAGCGCLVRIAGHGGGAPDAGFLRYQDWINSLVEPDAIRRERFVESPLVHPSVVLRREAFEQAGGYCDPGWAEDYDLWLRMMDAGMRFAKVPKVLFDWQDGPKRLTRTDPRYSERNFLRAKAHYLARLPRIRERGVMISGAGPIGKMIAKFLKDEGVRVHGFLDLSPRRVGRSKVGFPVHHAEDVPAAAAESPIQLSAVGRAGRRDAVREWMKEAGYTEGVDFFCVA